MNNVIRCIVVGFIYKSQQNGQVYDPNGVAPTICVGHHAGVEPRIIVYEDDQDEELHQLCIERQGQD